MTVDTEPGTITLASNWPGRWETITRGDYHALIEASGGQEALSVHASCTHPDDRNYVLTAWGLRDGNYPLVQSEMDGCDTSVPPGEWERCPGRHTFAKFIYDRSMEDDDE